MFLGGKFGKKKFIKDFGEIIILFDQIYMCVCCSEMLILDNVLDMGVRKVVFFLPSFCPCFVHVQGVTISEYYPKEEKKKKKLEAFVSV